MTNNNYAVLDLDDTILDLESELLKVYPELESMTPTQRLANRNTLLKKIEDHDILSNLKKYNTVDNLIEFLNFNDIKIKIISARAWLPNSWEVTKHNLEKNNIPYDELIICHLHENKSTYLKDENNYKLSIEDNPYNHQDFVKSGQIEAPYCIIRPAYDYDGISNMIECLSQIYK